MIGLIWLLACENSDSLVSNNQFDLSKNNQVAIPTNQQKSNSPEIIYSEKKSDNMPPRYVGCWSGMRGGKIKITNDKIFDLNAKQSSPYKEVLIKRGNDFEDYLLETNEEFSKSFLNKFVLIHYRNDGGRSILSYDSYEQYQKDKFTGFGFFEENDCKQFD